MFYMGVKLLTHTKKKRWHTNCWVEHLDQDRQENGEKKSIVSALW